jgi:hypothetical protein
VHCVSRGLPLVGRWGKGRSHDGISEARPHRFDGVCCRLWDCSFGGHVWHQQRGCCVAIGVDVIPLAQERGVGVINAAAVALGLLTHAGPPPYIAQLAGEEICTAARRTVEVCQRHGADVSFLANQYSIQRSGCATTLIGTTKQQHLDSALAAAEEPIDEDLLAAAERLMLFMPPSRARRPALCAGPPAAAVAGDAGRWIQRPCRR